MNPETQLSFECVENRVNLQTFQLYANRFKSSDATPNYAKFLLQLRTQCGYVDTYICHIISACSRTKCPLHVHFAADAGRYRYLIHIYKKSTLSKIRIQRIGNTNRRKKLQIPYIFQGFHNPLIISIDLQFTQFCDICMICQILR